MFDYHMHSYISYDGHDAPETMLHAAQDAGLREICFTDHLDYLHCLPREKTSFTPEAYSNAYDRLTAKGILIRKGVEVGLTPWNMEELNRDLTTRHYDFVLGSVHFIDDEDPYLPPYWVGKTVEQAEKSYFAEMLRCVRCHDNFDVLGHLTYIGKVRAHPNPRAVALEDYRDVIVEIMKELVEKGKGIEVNTSGIDRCGAYLPTAEYLRLFKSLGGEIVTVGSDAHTYDRVGQYTREACAMVQEIFGYVCTFADRKPIFHKL